MRIEREVDQLAHLLNVDRSTLVVTASYGRLSAYNLAAPFARRRTLRWFQDEYSYHLARYSDLPFHFIGHSNGTYMLGQSLRNVRAMRFSRIFLAGSVLPRDFTWRRYHDEKQVGQLVNMCSSRDKPVAWLCSALRGLRMRDVGVGGFTGFDVLPDDALQVRYLPGGHDAAVTSERLPAIARFIATGETVEPTGLAQPTALFSQISRLAPVAALVLAAGVLLAAIYAVVTPGWLPWILLVAAILVVAVIVKTF